MALGERGRKQGNDARRNPRWEAAPRTDFAMTTVNVPDRLDVQELRAREDEDVRPSRSRRSSGIDRYTLGLWFRRLLALTALGALVFFGYRAFKPIYEDLAAPRIAERLTRSLGQRVMVGESSVEFTRAPRLVLRNVDVAGVLRIDEVGLGFSSLEVARSIRSPNWSWGEATVPSLDLTHDQVLALVDALPGLTAALPGSVSLLRLASVGFPEYPLLPGRYEVILRRQDDSRFGPIQLQAEAGDSRLRMRLTPRPDSELGFQLEAANWQAPVGPSVAWTDVAATGYLGPRYIVVENLTGSGPYGVVQGAAAAGYDLEWALTGAGRAINIDLEAVFRHLRGPSPAGSNEGSTLRVPMTGLATMDLRLSGRASALSDAIARASLGGPVDVRNAQLNGINLGLLATQGLGAGAGGAGGGVTRFAELNAVMSASGNRIVFSNIRGRAGAMAARGEVVANDDLSLEGAVRVDLGTTRVVAPYSLRIRGNVLAPEFRP